MPASSISVYMRKVVSGVRSSCVTAETNSARRSDSCIEPRSSSANAEVASTTNTQPTTSATRSGRARAGAGSSRRPGTSRSGSVASLRSAPSDDPIATGNSSAFGSRSAISARSVSCSVGQSSQLPSTR